MHEHPAVCRLRSGRRGQSGQLRLDHVQIADEIGQFRSGVCFLKSELVYTRSQIAHIDSLIRDTFQQQCDCMNTARLNDARESHELEMVGLVRLFTKLREPGKRPLLHGRDDVVRQ